MSLKTKVNFSFIALLIFCSACIPKYGVNPKTSEIGLINVKSPEQYHNIIDSLNREFKSENLDSIWQLKYSELDTGYFLSGEIIYFKENPKELILIDYYSIRAVYNQLLSKDCYFDEDILNGLSPNLDSINRVRIINRVNSLFK